jgi:putative ABC transport system substrate-binding protein
VATDSAAVERSIQSLARPGGNVTGFTLFEFSIVGKMLETLKKTVPAMMRTAIIFHPDNPSAPGYARVFENAAPALNVKPVIASVRSAGDIERVINEISREPNGGLIVAADQFAVLHRELIVAMAAQRKLPVIYAYRTFIPIGGLMSYGANIYDLYRQAASYVDRILKGTRPDELPVQTPIRYELIINLKIAKTLGIEIPPQVLALADEVIE